MTRPRPSRAPRRGVLALVLAHAAACLTPPDVVPMDAEEAAEAGLPLRTSFAEDAVWDETVGPGDLLRVNVFDHPQLSSQPFAQGINGTPVQGDGAIQLPLVGELQVAGLTPSEIRVRVEEALAPFLKQPSVDVAIVEHGSKRVFVVGAVDTPGAFPLERPTSVLEALTFAGGFDQYANREQIAWLRAGSTTLDDLLIVDAEEVDLLMASRVTPGDLLFVGRRDWADGAEAARDILPILQSVAFPLSVAIQAATLERLR